MGIQEQLSEYLPKIHKELKRIADAAEGKYAKPKKLFDITDKESEKIIDDQKEEII